MPQASQSPTSPRPDERAVASPRPHSGQRAPPRISCCPGPLQRGPPGRDPPGPGRFARTVSGSVPAAMPTRSPNTWTIRRPCEALVARLTPGSRLALSLYGLTESTSFSVAGLSFALRILETEPVPAIAALLELGLLAVDSGRKFRTGR